jgi:pyrroloquinoline quinone biosynthesis protein D
VPRIASKARLQWDETRERHVLLYPEGFVALNPTGAEILKLCDGVRTVVGVASELESRYNTGNIAADVREFLDGLAKKNLVRYDDPRTSGAR